MTGSDGLMFLKTDAELTTHAQHSCGLGSRLALYTSHCSGLKKMSPRVRLRSQRETLRSGSFRELFKYQTAPVFRARSMILSDKGQREAVYSTRWHACCDPYS